MGFQFLIWMFAIAIVNTAVGAETLLSISVSEAERVSSDYTYLLFSVENNSDQRFESTEWSCVFLDGATPVFENSSVIRIVPPHNRVI